MASTPRWNQSTSESRVTGPGGRSARSARGASAASAGRQHGPESVRCWRMEGAQARLPAVLFPFASGARCNGVDSRIAPCRTGRGFGPRHRARARRNRRLRARDGNHYMARFEVVRTITAMYGRPRFVKRCIQQWIEGRDCSHVSGLDVRLMPAVPDGIRWSAPYQRCEPRARVAYQASANHGPTVLPSLFDRLSNRWSGDFSCVRLYR